MAHTNSTANYELSQFLGTDKPAWLVDYNGDMQKIDTALKNNADAASANSEDIQDLQDAIGAEGLTGRITNIENDIGDIKTEIGVVPLPTTAQSLTGAVAELKGVNDDQNTAIGVNANNIAQVGGAVEGVSQLAYTIGNVYDSSATYAVGAYAIYQNTLYKCTTAINVGEPFDPAKWTSVKVMSEVGQGGGGGTSYTAGDGINITNNVISFDDDTAPYDNTDSGLSATTVKGAIDELATSSGSLTQHYHITTNGNATIDDITKYKFISLSTENTGSNHAGNTALALTSMFKAGTRLLPSKSDTAYASATYVDDTTVSIQLQSLGGVHLILF